MLAQGSRFALDPLIAEAKRRALRRRLFITGWLAVVALGGVAIATQIPGAPGSSAGTGTVSDGVLRMALPPGWSASVAPGFYLTHPQAWVLVGDFHLAHGAARLEGGPTVPDGHVLVTIGDFYSYGAARDWQAVTQLRVPRSVVASGRWWSARYAGRALSIQVKFESRPTRALITEVQSFLRGIHRIGLPTT